MVAATLRLARRSPAILTDAGSMVEWVKYSSYGVPFALPAGDTDSDGDWDATDSAAITGAYEVRKDANLDGVINASDVTHANSITGGYQTLGRGRLSSSGVDNRKGYAGYEYDPTFEGAGRHLYHVRHRVYDADLGRWLRRDPLGYVDGMSLYEYVRGAPLLRGDSSGLFSQTCGGGGCGGSLPGRAMLWPDDSPPVCRDYYTPPPPPASPKPTPSPTPPPSPSGVFDWRNCPQFSGCTGGIRPKPGMPATSNGCGSNLFNKGIIRFLFPAFASDFRACCDNHDFCYGSCGADKNFCDRGFFQCMMSTCDTLYPRRWMIPSQYNPNVINHERCIQSAYFFYKAVRDFGEDAFCAAQAQRCACVNPPPTPAPAPRTPSPVREPRPDPKRPLW